VLVLEKAWAKVHGSYASIASGTPRDVFKAVTYAPAETLSIKQGEDDRERVWRIMTDHSMRGHPCCVTTDEREELDW
jgi:hypothetical protein